MSSRILKTILLLLLLPISLFAVKKVVDWRKSATGLPARIVIDTQKKSSLPPSSLWQNISQGGEEPLDMIRPVFSQICQLSPQLIRLDHIFDYFDVYQGPNNFNFSKLDPIIDTIILTGATPMLSLSYTPVSLSQTGQADGQPNDWHQWYQLVKATAKRYSVDKGIANIYYEVWNEPDLFGGWHYGKSPSYTTLFLHTARAVADGASLADYKIGGPATTGLYPNWIKSLLDTVQTQDLPLHFLSWHRYSPDISDYQKDIQQLNNVLALYPQYSQIEKIITEAGPFSDPHSSYDNQLSAIHLMSLVSQTQGQIHKIFSFEAVDGPDPRSGECTGWGLLTHPSKGSLPKPRYYAFQFLNQLSGQTLLSEGNGTWVSSLSTKDGSIVKTLLVNYDPSATNTQAVPVTYKNVTPGSYLLKTTKFLGSSSQKQIEVYSYNHNETVLLLPNTALLLELIPQF